MIKQVKIYVDIDECIKAVKGLLPEEVFNQKDLETWAESNGYEKVWFSV